MQVVRATRKPIAVEAVQWAGPITYGELTEWAGDLMPGRPWLVLRPHGLQLWRFGHNTWETVPVGAWLIKKADGGIFWRTPEQFEEDYEVKSA